MKQVFKKITLALLFTGLTVATLHAQTGKKMKPKKHHCTAACANGKHMYKHGEKGHVCTDACKKGMTIDLKEHVCTDACKDGQHMYMHGEKGHVCTADCKKPS